MDRFLNETSNKSFLTSFLKDHLSFEMWKIFTASIRFKRITPDTEFDCYTKTVRYTRNGKS